MTQEVYLIGGPAAGRVLTIPDDQSEVTIQFFKAESAPGKMHREGKYAPKSSSDAYMHEYHWMGEY